MDSSAISWASGEPQKGGTLLSLPPLLSRLPLPPLHQVAKYQSILETASGADQTVREKFQNHKEAIVLLGKPVAELQAALPKAGALSPHIQGCQVGLLL